MSNTFLIKRSSVANKVPTTAQIALGEIAINTFDGIMYIMRNNGANQIIPIGPWHSTASGIQLQGVAGKAPQETYEFDDRALLFSQGAGQAVVAFVRVPAAYLAGMPISLKLGHYTPGATNNVKMQTLTTLIRKNTDAVTATTNQYTSTNGDTLLTLANKYFEVSYDLTTSTGTINAVAVAAGDLLKVQLSRVATTGTEDTNDLRVLPNSAEFYF